MWIWQSVWCVNLILIHLNWISFTYAIRLECDSVLDLDLELDSLLFVWSVIWIWIHSCSSGM